MINYSLDIRMIILKEKCRSWFLEKLILFIISILSIIILFRIISIFFSRTKFFVIEITITTCYFGISSCFVFFRMSFYTFDPRKKFWNSLLQMHRGCVTACLRLSEKFRKCLLIRWRRARDHRSRKFLTAGRKNSWKIRILRLFRSVKILFSLFDSWIFKFSVKLKSRSLNGKVPLIFIQIKASVVTVSFFVKTKVKKGRILSSFFISKRWVTVL